MARSKRLSIIIAGDASGGIRSLGQIESRMGKTGRAFGKFGKAAALGIGAVAVAGAAAVVAVGRDLMNMERLNAQTATAIRSTGGVANVSARQIQNFSQRMQDLTGIQQETVIEGQNLLLTFTNVRNEVGAGNDIFTQASTAMADLSVAMGTDMTSASMLVGKALNNPLQGLSALSRAGVQFTDQQREQIEWMVESGNVMGAQKIILDELETQFGGSAAAFGETTAGQFARAKEAVMDAAEALVVRLMPAVSTAVAWFRERAIPAIQDFAEFIGPYLTEAFDVAVAWVRENWPQIQTTVTDVMTRVQSVITTVVDFVRTAWAAFGDDILGHIQRVWPAIQQTIEGVMDVIKGVISTVTAIISGDWGAAWDGIKQIFSGAWDVMVGTVRQSLSTIRLGISAAWQVVRNITEGAWNGIKRFLSGIWDGIKGGIRNLRDAIGNIWDSIKSVVAGPVNWLISNVVNPFLGFIRDVASFVGLGGAVPGPFGTIGGGGGGGGGPAQPYGAGAGMGDGPGIEAIFSGSGLGRRSAMSEAANGTGEGLGAIFGGGSQAIPMVTAAGTLADMVQSVTSAISGMTGLLGMLGGPPPFKAIMGGTLKRPIQFMLDFFKDYKKQISAPALSGGIGWEKMWAAVSGHFPGLQLFSAYRPGAITATGNASYHGMGRAVDISPRMDVFDWLVANYGRQSKEIIFSPAGSRQIHNGSPHYYGEPTRGDHWDHIHWAMAKGTPGWVKVRQPTAFVAGEAGTEYMNISRTRPGSGAVNINFYGPVLDRTQAVAWVEEGLRKGVSTPQLDRKVRRVSGAR